MGSGRTNPTVSCRASRVVANHSLRRPAQANVLRTDNACGRDTWFAEVNSWLNGDTVHLMPSVFLVLIA